MDFPVLAELRNLLDLKRIPFSARGSRITVIASEEGLSLRLIDRMRSQDFHPIAERALAHLVKHFALLDGEGNRLPVQLVTYPHCILLSTPIGDFSVAFEDSENIIIALPEAACGLTGVISLTEGVHDRRGGVFFGQGDDRSRLAYTTNRNIRDQRIEKAPEGGWRITILIEAGKPAGLLIHISTRLGMIRYVSDPKIVLNRAAQVWQDWFSRVPRVSPRYEPLYSCAWWLMRSGLINTRYFLSREAMLASKRHSSTVWQWDACYHALAYRHIDRKLAQDQLRILFDHQAPNGMIPDGVHENGLIVEREKNLDPGWSRPPMLAWVVWKLYERDQDVEFLSEIFDGLSRWLRWWLNRIDHGLENSTTPHSLFAEDMDDPAFIEEIPGSLSPDVKIFLYLQMDCLSRIAAVLGETTEAAFWKIQSETLLQQIQQEGSKPQIGLFWIQQQGRPVCVPTPLSLFTLLTGNAQQEQNRRLVEHLLDVEGFSKNFPLPIIHLEDEELDRLMLWRSPSWLSVAYLLLESLDRCGMPEVGDRFCADILTQIQERYSRKTPSESAGQRMSHAPIYGWTAALYIEMAIRASRAVEAPSG